MLKLNRARIKGVRSVAGLFCGGYCPRKREAFGEFQVANIMLGNLETATADTCHAFRFAKFAPRYLAEFPYRFIRRYRVKETLPAVLRAILAAPPCSPAAVRAPEVPC